MNDRIIATLDAVVEYLTREGLDLARQADLRRAEAGGWGPTNLYAGPVRRLIADVTALRADMDKRAEPRRAVICRDSNHVPRSMGGDGSPDARCTCQPE